MKMTKCFFLKIFSLFILSFLPINSFSQQVIDLVISWQEPKIIQHGQELIKVPSIANQSLDGLKPTYFWKEKTSNGKKIELISFESIDALPEETQYLNTFIPELGSIPEINFQITKAGKENYAVVYAAPFFKSSNGIKKITSIKLNLIDAETPMISKDFASSSVLKEGSGFWFKIAVTKDGIYKIDKVFLEACGINTSNLNPNHINIYGNGEGVLPEKNSTPRIDDLAKNSIYVHGDSDGVFNDADYILFYGWGPHRWQPNNANNFTRIQHLYSENSYYFINIDATNTPARITSNPSISDPATKFIDTYDYRDILENETTNLVGGGQRWYGDLFDIDLEKTFNFSIPDLDTFPIKITTALATSGQGTTQKFTLNGTTLFSSSMNYFGDFSRSESNFSFYTSQTNIPLKVSITRNNPSILTYLDHITLNTRRKLSFYGTQMNFRNLTGAQPGIVSEYSINSMSQSGFIWDLLDKNNPKIIPGSFLNGKYIFNTDDSYREFVASNGTSFYTPERIGSVNYQNLHGLDQADYLIVTHPDFLGQATRLADLHRQNGTTTHVVTTNQIYNEFSSGSPDATAIRMFAKMFYDRAIANPGTAPKHLLLFGDGTYDPKNRVANNNNYVLTYQALNSENYISCYVSDDYFGLLNDNESFTSADLLDIGIGRLLISDLTQAKQQVDKIEHYMKNGSSLFNSNTGSCCLNTNNNLTYGDWRLKYVQIADDEEEGYFINFDTEPQYNSVKNNHFEMNCDKLYMDAYPQQTTAGGQRFPDVYNAITDRVQRGALIVNYVGHGGEVGLAEERVVTIPQINSWTNINALHLFVSATCEFTKYDDPKRVSAGEWVSLNPSGGAIALMTTTRSVYFGVNSTTGQAFYNHVFDRNTDGSPLTFGEIMMKTKNDVGQNENKRSFTLIGDPALKIALPQLKVVTDSINGKNPFILIDTLNALSTVRIKGHIEDNSGNLLSTYNGQLIPSIFDKVKTQKTLGQDPESPEIEYNQQRNVVYKGKNSITNGYFDFTFVVPKDIALNMGRGKISYYAFNDASDAFGFDTNFRIGGINANGINDIEGPQLNLFINDENFISGSITDESPVMILNAFDENGINTVGNGIGHDLVAILDGNSSEPILLNDYYSAALDSYQSGEIRYQFTNLEQGKHTLEVKVWDVNNNSSVVKTEFIVQNKANTMLEHVYNYPNPFTTRTSFQFEHNQSCSNLDVQIQIFTISGKLVKSINKAVNTIGFRTEGIEWDGKDDFGDALAKGVYVYRLSVKNNTGEQAEKIEKLVLLK
jgi:hypothetical protein